MRSDSGHALYRTGITLRFTEPTLSDGSKSLMSPLHQIKCLLEKHRINDLPPKWNPLRTSLRLSVRLAG